jgi:hypothetical protein
LTLLLAVLAAVLLALGAGGAAAQSQAPVFAPVAPPPLIPGAAQGERQPAVSASQLSAQQAAQGAAVAPAAAASSTRLPRDGSNADASATRQRNEPAVQNSVIEDGATRIEETKVRGAVRSIHVAPKGAAAGLAYEVLPAQGPGGPREQRDSGPASTHGSAGQRVWSIFSF